MSAAWSWAVAVAGQTNPCAADENQPLVDPGEDRAWALRLVRFGVFVLRQENAQQGIRQGLLLDSPDWRRYYEDCRTLERALVWKYFERR